MHTAQEIVEAAAQLPEEELRQVLLRIRRLEQDARAITVSLPDASCRLVRLSDGEFYELFARSIAIEEDHGYGLRMVLALRAEGQDLNFAEVYLALKELTGESSRHLDDWKGAFSFPFALEVHRDAAVFEYLFEVRPHRDSLYFPVRKLVPFDDPRLAQRLIHPPCDEELSGDDINRLLTFFYGYLTGYWETARQRPRASFVKQVPSSLILFGWVGGQTFEERFESQETFKAAFERFQEQATHENSGERAADACVIR